MCNLYTYFNRQQNGFHPLDKFTCDALHCLWKHVDIIHNSKVIFHSLVVSTYLCWQCFYYVVTWRKWLCVHIAELPNPCHHLIVVISSSSKIQKSQLYTILKWIFYIIQKLSKLCCSKSLKLWSKVFKRIAFVPSGVIWLNFGKGIALAYKWLEWVKVSLSHCLLFWLYSYPVLLYSKLITVQLCLNYRIMHRTE